MSTPALPGSQSAASHCGSGLRQFCDASFRYWERGRGGRAGCRRGSGGSSRSGSPTTFHRGPGAPGSTPTSSRRSSARSPRTTPRPLGVGAIGLMQLMPDTARLVAQELGRPARGSTALWEPPLNITLGTRYLAQLTRGSRTRSWPSRATTRGPHRVQRWAGRPAARSTSRSSWTRSPSTRHGRSPSACTRAGTTTGASTGARPRLGGRGEAVGRSSPP